MVDFRLLNGSKKVTVIETFDGQAIVVSPEGRTEFKSLDEAKEFTHGQGIEINISMIHGSSLKREVLNHG